MTAAVVRLDARLPFDHTGVLGFLASRVVPGVESVVGPVYERAGVAVSIDPTGATVSGERAVLGDAVPLVARLLDLDADPVAIGAVLGADAALAPLVAAAPGLRVPGAWDPFEVVVRAIVGQQVTVAAARTLLGRLVARCGGDGLPSPDVLLAADLDGLGMPGARVRTLRAAAAAVADGTVVLDGSAPAQEVTAALLGVPGIGPWTASYVAMRALGDGDSFPVADVGLRNAAANLGLPTKPAELAARAERWRPWRAYATVHLWRTLG